MKFSDNSTVDVNGRQQCTVIVSIKILTLMREIRESLRGRERGVFRESFNDNDDGDSWADCWLCRGQAGGCCQRDISEKCDCEICETVVLKSARCFCQGLEKFVHQVCHNMSPQLASTDQGESNPPLARTSSKKEKHPSQSPSGPCWLILSSQY